MADEQQHAAPQSAAEIEAIRERAESATPGPWESPSAIGDMVFVLGLNQKIADCERSADAKFIARARADIPRLLATLAAYRAIVAAVANGATVSWDSGTELFYCDACNRDWSAPDIDVAIATIVHKPGCIVTRARELVGMWAEDVVVQSATDPPSASDHEHEWEPADARYEVVDDEGSTRKWYRVRCVRCGLIWEHP